MRERSRWFGCRNSEKRKNQISNVKNNYLVQNDRKRSEGVCMVKLADSLIMHLPEYGQEQSDIQIWLKSAAAGNACALPFIFFLARLELRV